MSNDHNLWYGFFWVIVGLNVWLLIKDIIVRLTQPKPPKREDYYRG